MKKQILCIFFSLLIILQLVSCAADPAETKSNHLATAPTYDPASPDILPFSVENLTEARKLWSIKEYYQQVKQALDPGYICKDTEHAAYTRMLATISDFGALPMIDGQSNTEAKITFFPERQYEDVGIKCSYQHNGAVTDYFVYFQKSEFSRCTTLRQYWDQRFGPQYHASAESDTISYGTQSIAILSYSSSGASHIAFSYNGLNILVRTDSVQEVIWVLDNLEYIEIS